MIDIGYARKLGFLPEMQVDVLPWDLAVECYCHVAITIP